MATTKVAPKSNESPRERFVKLANARTSKAIQTIDLLSNLAAPARYEYTDEDVEKIQKVLTERVEVTIRALRDRKPPRGAGFRII